MADFSTDEKTNVLFKNFIGVPNTKKDREWYQESYKAGVDGALSSGHALNYNNSVDLENIWAANISTNFSASNESVTLNMYVPFSGTYDVSNVSRDELGSVLKVEKLKLQRVESGNDQSWYCLGDNSVNVLKNIIPFNYKESGSSRPYAYILYNGSTNEMPYGATGGNWMIDHKSGLVYIPDASEITIHADGLYLTFYKYIGQPLSNVIITDDNNVKIGIPNFHIDRKLTASDGAANDNFGYSVAISGNYAIVGARGKNTNTGSAYIYNVTTGAELHKLNPNGTKWDDNFGVSVAISGNYAIVGAHARDDIGGSSSDSGSFFIYNVQTGAELHKLTASDWVFQGYFGWSVAIDGNYAIVSSRNDDDKGPNSGSVYIFDVTTGAELRKLTASDGAANDNFGFSVAISGNYAIVGATAKNTSTGSAYIYNVTTGEQLYKLLPNGSKANDQFGRSVAISGNYAIVGAHGRDDKAPDCGSAYIYNVQTGTELHKLIASDGATGEQFGYSVAIDGNYAIVGAVTDDDKGSNSGSVYIFNVTTGAELRKLTASDGAAGDTFGHSVAIDGNCAIVGAPLDDDKGLQSGSAYIIKNEISQMQITKGGNVGIGTTEPISGLHIKNDNGLTVSSTAPTGTRTAVLRLGSPYQENHDAYCAKITSTNNQSSNYNSDLRFFTSNGNNQYANERMCILSNGYIGIGTTEPYQKLQVNGNILLQGIPNGYMENVNRYIGVSSNNGEVGVNGFTGISINHPDLHPGSQDINFWTHQYGATTLGGTPKMTIRYNGNVGIGTTSPNCALEVHGGAGSNDEVLILSNKKDDAASEYHSIFTLGGQHYDVYYNSTIQSGKSASNGSNFHINYFSGGNVSLCGNGNGNVGIGTTNPEERLYVQGNISLAPHPNQPTTTEVLEYPVGKQNAISFYNSFYSAGSGESISSNKIKVWNNFISSKKFSDAPYDGEAAYHAYLVWSYTKFGDGNKASVAMRLGTGNGTSELWMNGSIVNSSDRRIKTNIIDVPDDLALEMVRKIPCRYYEYKRNIHNEYDYRKEKPNRTIGFIAQEVKDICPEAVSLIEYKIPLDNKIYRDIQIDNSKNFIIIKDFTNNDLSGNDELECIINPKNNNNNITEDNVEDNKVIKIKYISDCKFEILDDIDNVEIQEILLKNKKVDDFHTLDKNKLFALNFSATQELDRQQQADKVKIAELETKVSTLESELSSIKAQLGL